VALSAATGEGRGPGGEDRSVQTVARVLFALTTDFPAVAGTDYERVLPGLEWMPRPHMAGWRVFARLLTHARNVEAVVLDGSTGLRGGYLDLIAAAILPRLPGGPVVVMSDATWKRGRLWWDRLAGRMAIRLLDNRRVIYCVLSTDEANRFPLVWRVDPERVRFVPWPYILSVAERTNPPDGTWIFSGGDSLRDYEPLLQAARGLPATVYVATRNPRIVGRRDLPPNVRAGPVSPTRFTELLRGASVVVVPLAPTDDRSAGQTTYANAMALGKLVVATDVLGVRDYLEHGKTGLIVPPGDSPALRTAMEWALRSDSRDEVRRIRVRARQAAEKDLSPDLYVRRLFQVAQSTISGQG
jgi:glycosyltransferase involved in cell wall biosynthesis